MKIRVLSQFRDGPNNVDEIDDKNPIALFFRMMDGQHGDQIAAVTITGVDGGITVYERVRD